MSKIIFSIAENRQLAEKIAADSQLKLGNAEFRRFPDGDAYVRIESEVKNKQVYIVASLNWPDDKVMQLIFFAETAKRLGAKKVTLIAPYLAYMRQDKEFHLGESINSRIFGHLISQYFDELITIDPHLHRHKSLGEIYSIPAKALHAGKPIADWILKNIKKPLLIGPDSESKQWVADIANKIQAPYLVLEKIRHGDHDVEVSVPDIEQYRDHTPVLVDDIISTAHTMIETIKHLHKFEMRKIICIGVHAIFAGDAYQNLLETGIEKVVTCNTITHISNGIDVSSILKA